MIYITLNGNRRPFRHPPTIVMRSINLRLLEPGTWVEDEFLSLIWKHFGYLCTTVRLRDTYRPEGAAIVHNYDLFFQIGKNLIEPKAINDLLTVLENEAEQTLKVEVPAGHRHRADGRHL
jgi:hypothetical protein